MFYNIKREAVCVLEYREEVAVRVLENRAGSCVCVLEYKRV